MRQDTLRGRIIVLIVVAALALSATAGVLIAQGSNARFEVVADSGPLPLSATLLLDGTVFVAGSNGVRLYDPSARAFTVLSVPPNLRDVHRATLLENGTVLITGGRTQDSTALTFVTHTDVLIYNPASPRFTTVGPLSVPRNGHSTTLLPDGRVLILGGADQQGGFGDPHDTHASAEIYDPTTERFSPAGSLLVARQNHAATLLPDGTVAVAGGPNSEGTTRTVEIFDPGSGTSRAAAETSSTFSNPAMFQRLDGTLALVDGAVGAEIIDLETGIARVAVATDDLPRTVSGGTSVALQDGRVLIIGGRVLGPEGGASPPTSTGETILIDLEAGAAVAGPTLNTPRFAHVSVTLPDATVLVFGGANIQDGAFVGFGTAVEQLFDLPAVLPVLPTPPDTAPPPPPPAQQFFLGPGFNLTGWLWATSVEDATAAIAGQFDSIFRWDAATRTFAAFQAAGPAFLNDLDELVFGDALWVFVSDPAGAVWEQPRFTEARDVDLLAGFNMVLWTGPDGAPVEDALAGIAAGLIGAFIWDQATQSFRTFAPDAPSFVNTADVLTYGAGLWLQIRAATTWSQPASAP